MKLCGLPDKEGVIKNILEQNKKAIDDIDGLLTTVKCSLNINYNGGNYNFHNPAIER